MASTFVSKGIAFVGSIFIARILFPEDFGYIVLAEIISGFIMLAANSGFENFYLQEKIEDEGYEAEVLGITHRLRLLFNAALFSIQVGVSFVVQYAFGEEIVGTMVRILALGHLLNGITMSRQYVLRKRLEFRIESIANIVRDALSTVAKVGFAFTGLGAVSIAMGAIVGGLGRSLVFLTGCRKIPMSKEWDSGIVKRVWHFGMHSFSGSIAMYLSSYIDRILLSVNFNKSEVGFYSFGYSRADMTKSYTTRPLGSLVISWIARNKGDGKKILKGVCLMTYVQSAFLIPIITFLIVYADAIIPFVFGSQWASAIPLFRIFLGLQLLTCLTENIGVVLTGLGFPKLLSKLIWAKLIFLTVSLTVVMLLGNIYMYALIFSLVFVFFALVRTYYCLQKIDSNFQSYFREVRLASLVFWSFLYLIVMLSIRGVLGDLMLAVIVSMGGVGLLVSYNFLHINRSITGLIVEWAFPRRFTRFVAFMKRSSV